MENISKNYAGRSRIKREKTDDESTMRSSLKLVTSPNLFLYRRLHRSVANFHFKFVIHCLLEISDTIEILERNNRKIYWEQYEGASRRM